MIFLLLVCCHNAAPALAEIGRVKIRKKSGPALKSTEVMTKRKTKGPYMLSRFAGWRAKRKPAGEIPSLSERKDD
jgi:hypothetical protein